MTNPYDDRELALGSTDDSFKFYLDRKKDFGKVVRAVVRYNDPAGRNLVLQNEHGDEMVLSNMNGGYEGTGPSGTVDVLVDSGFGRAEDLRPLVEAERVTTEGAEFLHP